jgi:hypothetical protein
LRFMAAGFGIGAIGIAGRIAGVGGFDAYPRLSIAADGATLLLAAAIVAAAALPVLGSPRWRRHE